VFSAAFSANGALLASVENDQMVELWRLVDIDVFSKCYRERNIALVF
jgi:hypothetical protein